MSESLTWFVGNRQPSISETITVDDVPVDLTGSTVRFKMRAVGSSTLKVDQPAVIVSAPAGTVRYDWAALDVDTAGQYLIWWEVTSGSKTQDMAEALIEFRAHANAAVYVELEQLKSTLELTGTSFADQDLRLAAEAASRMVDERTGRRFYPDADAAQVRYFTAVGRSTLDIDDLITLTSLKTDVDADGTYETVWTLNADFVLEPLNAVALGQPFDKLRLYPRGTRHWNSWPRSIEVTGKFGWLVAPAQVKVATTLVAARLLKRAREAPFGVAGFGADGAAVRVARFDSDVEALLAPFMRRPLVA